jgi:hypothetical protein
MSRFTKYKSLFQGDGSSFLPGGMSFSQGFQQDLGNYNPLSDSSGGASTGMDPLTAGLGIANLGASIFGGMAQRRTQANIANAQLAAAADQLKNQVEMTRDMSKFQEASNINNLVFSAGTGADLAYDRQRKAALFTQGPLRELKLAGDMAERRAFLGLAGSEEAKALSRRQNKEALKRTLADRQGAMMGMFGRIAPVNVENLFV